MLAFACQLDTNWEDPARNLDRIQRLIEEAAPPPGSMAVFPEMATTGFSMQLDGLAEPPMGTAESRLAGLALKHQIYLAVGLAVALPATGKTANQLITFSPSGQVISRYTKLHPFSLLSEQNSLTPGESIDRFNLAGFNVSPFICYDLRFPEIFREASSAGAQLFIISANWLEYRQDHWTTLARARAIENQAYVIAVNRVGSDPGHNYLGGSLIIDPNGTVLASAGNSEQSISADISTDTVIRHRTELPFLADRRTIPPQLP